MNTIARASGALVVALFFAAPAAAQLGVPEGGDCRFFAAQGGPYWQGRFGGAGEDLFGHRRLIGRKACFTTERDCTRWLHEMMSFADDTDYMFCKPVGG
jgi:hypothetical protein